MSKRSSKHHNATNHPAPVVEPLEGRRMLSATLNHGLLEVRGSDGDDEITIEQTRNPRRMHVTVNDEKFSFKSHQVHRTIVRSLDGDDVVEAGERLKTRTMQLGGRGDDTLVGGGGPDILRGGLGDDDLTGGRGKDRLFGEEGQDVFQSSDSLKEMKDRDEDDGVRVRLEEANSLVQAAVLDLLDGNDFRNLLRESDDGEIVYELEWDAPGPHSAKINLAGDVIELEVEIDPGMLPAAVTAAIAARYPDGEITEAETLELPDTPLRYEVEVENEGLVRELVVTPAGEILADDVEGPIEE